MEKRIAGLSECKTNRKFKRTLVPPDDLENQTADNVYSVGGTDMPYDTLMGDVLPEDPLLSIFNYPGFPTAVDDQFDYNLKHLGQEALFHQANILAAIWPLDSNIDESCNLALPSDRSTSSSYTGLSSLRERLSQYSTPYLRKLNRLLKAHSISNSSAATLTIPAYSISFDIEEGSVTTVQAPPSAERPHKVPKLILPNAFLVIDRYKERQGICIPGLKLHDLKTCWCAVLTELGHGTKAWITEPGVPPRYITDLVETSDLMLIEGLDTNFEDDFGNTVLHLLAARKAPLHIIFQAIEQGAADPNAQNMAGQTFLHILDKRLLRTLLIDIWIVSFLQALNALSVKFDIPDLFGRTFYHILTDHARNLEQHTLRHLRPLNAKLPASRDAFGCTVTLQPEIESSTSHMEALSQNRQPGSTYETATLILLPGAASSAEHASISSHARLLETARLALDAPWLEDSEGRNGLHCLAEASMRMSIKNTDTPSSRPNKRRKRDQADPDSPSARLSLRYELVRNMIGCGVRVNDYDKQGSTVLMAFVTHLQDGEDDKILANIFQHLILWGADVHMRNTRGETALHIAVRLGRKVATKVLLESGANVHARTVSSQGVLAVAQTAYFNAKEDQPLYASIIACIALAIQHGAVPAPTMVQEWSIKQGGAVLELESRRKPNERAS
jgi:hypothetical protein